jgi:hypothetical protein
VKTLILLCVLFFGVAGPSVAVASSLGDGIYTNRDMRGQSLDDFVNGRPVRFLRVDERGHIMLPTGCDLTELLAASREFLPHEHRWSGHLWSTIPDIAWEEYNGTWHRWRLAVWACSP